MAIPRTLAQNINLDNSLIRLLSGKPKREQITKINVCRDLVQYLTKKERWNAGRPPGAQQHVFDGIDDVKNFVATRSIGKYLRYEAGEIFNVIDGQAKKMK